MTTPAKKSAEFLTTEIFDAIHHVMHQLRSRQYAVFKNRPFKLTHMEGKVLAIIGNTPGTTLRDLVHKSGRDKGQLARLIKTLKQQSLVKSETDVNDKRSVKLFLTPEGESLYSQIQRELESATELAVESLSQSERSTLLKLLSELRDALDSEK